MQAHSSKTCLRARCSAPHAVLAWFAPLALIRDGIRCLLCVHLHKPLGVKHVTIKYDVLQHVTREGIYLYPPIAKRPLADLEQPVFHFVLTEYSAIYQVAEPRRCADSRAAVKPPKVTQKPFFVRFCGAAATASGRAAAPRALSARRSCPLPSAAPAGARGARCAPRAPLPYFPTPPPLHLEGGAER